jgi:ABC-2 type transport system permease protein
LMSESLQKIGLLTFNAWAIDGYDKVFWREMPVGSLAPQLAVLALSSVLFLCIARLLAIRWEVK